jgi:hypothetical protein
MSDRSGCMDVMTYEHSPPPTTDEVMTTPPDDLRAPGRQVARTNHPAAATR